MGFNGEDKQTCAWIDGVYSLLQEKHVNLKNVNVYVSRKYQNVQQYRTQAKYSEKSYLRGNG